MLRHAVTLACLALAFAASPSAAEDASSDATTDAKTATIAFRDATVLPMDRDTRLPHHTVVVRDGRIVAVGPNGDVDVPDDAHVVDASGKFLMPGLAEMHGHVPPVAQAQALDHVLTLLLANGVTTVRGVLGEPGHLALRDALAKGERFGPRLYTSGPSINGNSVQNPEHGAAMVAEQKAAGYDLLKLHPGLTTDEFDAVMKAAKRERIPVTGHVSADVGLLHALEMRQACIEHLDDYVRALVPPDRPARTADPGWFGLAVVEEADASRIPLLVNATREAGTAVTTTETLMVNLLGDIDVDALLARPEYAFVPKATKAQWKQGRQQVRLGGWSPERGERFLALRRDLLKALHAGGVPVVLGSDAPQMFNVPGFSAHRELALMVDAGLTPYEALRTGTANAAAHLGAGDVRGAVRIGHDADFVLLGADPTEDIAHIGDVEGVMVFGRWHDRAALDAELAHVRAAVSSES